MEWLIYVLFWYIVLFVIGLIFTPVTQKIFGSFYDRGYPFAKAVGILFLTYFVYAVGTLKILRFDYLLIGLGIAVGVFINYKFYKKLNQKKEHTKIILFIAEEIVFFGAFFAWAYIRSHQPAIRGLEKFMDYGFIQSAIRGPYFPSQDMWLAGHSINYYYFGHVTGALLIQITKIPAVIGYNLILATLFALGITEVFSLAFNIAYLGLKKMKLAVLTGVLGSFIVNLGGNLHTVYALMKGYNTDKPVPFWELESKYKLIEFLNPKILLERLGDAYWYPNATRFIPLTIHEFPIYSYVVADLHGHVFDIPFVLLTIAVLFTFFHERGIATQFDIRKIFSKLLGEKIYYIHGILIGFLIAIHYMTNAFDAPIYLLLTSVIFVLVFGFSRSLVAHISIVAVSFIAFSLPFTTQFEPFASSFGVNCAPQFLVNMKTLGPFVFEQGNCQVSTWWELATLWGFFWFNFIWFAVYKFTGKKDISSTEIFVFVLFFVGTVLITIPEFLYAKDIYPSHFRANTMFKLGYQAFIMMGIASAFVFTTIKNNSSNQNKIRLGYIVTWIPVFTLIAIYPTFAIDSYYGHQTTKPTLDGSAWMLREYPEYREAITWLQDNSNKDTVILEAQGDSYTDLNIVSAYTGIPTVAGWHVHQWLWRGSSEVVGNLIPEVQTIYQSADEDETMRKLSKFNVEYVIVGPHERTRYPSLNEVKFGALGKLIFESSNRKLRIYKIPLDSI